MNILTATGIKYLFDRSTQSNASAMSSREEIISRLKFLGHLQIDEKIDTRSIQRQPNNIYTSLVRTIVYPDNRNNAYNFVREIIYRSFEILSSLILIEKNMDMFKSVIIDLLRAKRGISNLKQTYSSNTIFCCNLEVLIEKIDETVRNYIKDYPDVLKNIEE